MDLRDLQHTRGTVTNYNYKGLPIYCAFGIHEKAFEIIKNIKLNNDDKVLILGAGSGAFDQRIIDYGINNITAIEFCDNVYKLHNTTLIKKDLNKSFSDIGKFKLIIALEIIEHLENHFDFMRQINNLLEKDGDIILSTPNVESGFARIKFFLKGDLHFFCKELYSTGHINPVFNNLFEFNLRQNNLVIKNIYSNGNFWQDLIFNYPDIRFKVLYFIFFILSVFQLNKRKYWNNNINIYHIKN